MTPVVIAHRGDSRAAPENTLAAIRSAIELGVGLVEVDVQRTRDDVLVLMHDATVDRTTDGTGAVNNLTWEQVAKLNAGRACAASSAIEPVPALATALDLTVGANVTLVIEVKRPSRYPGVIDDLLRVIDAANARDQVVIASFDHTWLRELRHRAHDLRIGELWVWLVPGFAIERHTKLVSVFWSFVLLDPTLVRRMHRAGCQVWAWTVDNPRLIRLLHRFGVDGIVTSNLTQCGQILAGASS